VAEALCERLAHRERVPGGIRLRAEPGAARALGELIELERECCAWIDYQVDGSMVTLTAEGEGEAVLAGMFAPGQDSRLLRQGF